MGEMTELEKQIVQLRAEGLTAKAIASQIKSTGSAVQKRISRMIKKHNCKSFSHLYVTLSEKGHI